MCEELNNIVSQPENKDKIFTIAYIVAGYPPEISGVSLGNEERLTWFNQNTKNKLFIIAPDWGDTNEGVHTTLEERIFRFPSKPWLPYKNTRTARFTAKKVIEKMVSNINPDIIVVTDAERLFLFSLWSLPCLKYAKKRNIPYIAHFHTDYYGFAKRYLVWNMLKNILIKPTIKYIYKQMDQTICATLTAKSSLERYGVKKTYYVPFVGVDNTNFGNASITMNHLSSHLRHDSARRKTIIYLGRLAQEKRVDILIKAYFKLISRNSTENDAIDLIIAGEGPSEKSLRKICSGVERIVFTGKVFGEDKFRLLSSCDILCYPSPFETFGRSVIEAMISKTLVVVPSSSAMAEYIEDERNGFLFKRNDVDACAEALNKALVCESEKKEKIINDAYSTGKDFSIENGCKRLNEAYIEIIRRSTESNFL